jgi:glycogen synthase
MWTAGSRVPAATRARSVLMTADGVGGVWQYATDLSSALARRGVAVTIAVMGPQLDETHRADAARRGLHVLESVCKLEWMDEPWDDVARSGRWLQGLEDAIRPDIVHLNGYTHAALDWHAPTVVVAHSCVGSWWRAVRREAAPPSWDRYRDAVSRGLDAARVVVAPSGAMRAALREEYGCAREIVVVPNGRELGGSSRGSAARGKSDLILAAGRLWDEGKNVAALCEVAAGLSWPVYVAGDGGPSREVSGPPRNVHALGRLSAASLADWYERAAIYALPARYEPFGLSVLEAAASGCALVLGDIPSLRENWSAAALFVDPGDRGALRDAIQTLIADPSLRQRLGTIAARRAAEFTVERMARDYLEIYQSTLGHMAVA